MTPNCQIHPVPATGTCHNCRAFTCDKCAKIGKTCPYCKLSAIVPVTEVRKAVNQCANHPGIRAEAACPDCNRIFCASCLNPFGQCLECGARHPRQRPTVAPLGDPTRAGSGSRGLNGRPARARGGHRAAPRRRHLGIGRFVIGAAIVLGIGALLSSQYRTLERTLVGNKGRLGTLGANVGAYQRQVEAHGKDLDDIMGRIESGQYSPEDAAAVDDLLARIESGQTNLNTLEVGTRQKLEKARSLLETRAAYQARGEEYAGEDTGGRPARPYQGPPIRLRVGAGDHAAARTRGAEAVARRAAPRSKPLQIAITSPVPGARLHGMAIVSARLVGEGVDRVEFQVNGQWQGLSNQPPYRYEWDTTGVRNGAVTLRVVAYDTSGRQVASRPVRVTVQN